LALRVTRHIYNVQIPTTKTTKMAIVWNCQGIESSWNVMEHGDAREGKWRGNWRIEWVASTLHTISEHDVSSITTSDAHNSVASSRMNWRRKGLVPFAERRNLVSARVPSQCKSSLTICGGTKNLKHVTAAANEPVKSPHWARCLPVARWIILLKKKSKNI
jgi:hypothetical protein